MSQQLEKRIGRFKNKMDGNFRHALVKQEA
jgi:hypothetical protein